MNLFICFVLIFIVWIASFFTDLFIGNLGWFTFILILLASIAGAQGIEDLVKYAKRRRIR